MPVIDTPGPEVTKSLMLPCPAPRPLSFIPLSLIQPRGWCAEPLTETLESEQQRAADITTLRPRTYECIHIYIYIYYMPVVNWLIRII